MASKLTDVDQKPQHLNSFY